MKKAQVFVQDLIIAITIMSIVSLVYFGFYTNQDSQSDSRFQDVLSEAKTISDYLIGSGYPNEWNQSNVIRIGITNGDNVLNYSKLDSFSSIASSDYDMTRSLLKTKYDYIVFFRDYNFQVRNISGVTYIGKPGVNSTNIDDQDVKHLTKISRFVVIKEGGANVTSEIVEMVIYVWSEV